MTTLVVLCAGKSTRMGANKLLLELRGRPLVRWALEAGQAISPRIAVCHDPAVAALCRALGYQVVDNPTPEAGISGSIRLAEAAAQAGSALLFLPGDQPLLRPETLLRMVRAYEETGCPVAASLHGQWRSPCLFPPALRSELRTLTGDRGGKRLLRGREDVLALEAAPEEFLDADTPQALDALRRTLQTER